MISNQRLSQILLPSYLSREDDRRADIFVFLKLLAPHCGCVAMASAACGLKDCVLETPLPTHTTLGTSAPPSASREV